MSIKAYDGMKCDKDLHFIQDEILKRIDKFRELSINKLAIRDYFYTEKELRIL